MKSFDAFAIAIHSFHLDSDHVLEWDPPTIGKSALDPRK